MEQETASRKKANKALVALSCVFIIAGLGISSVGKGVRDTVRGPGNEKLVAEQCEKQMQVLSSRPDFNKAVQICIDRQKAVFSTVGGYASLMLYAGLGLFAGGSLLLVSQVRRGKKNEAPTKPSP